MSEKDRLDQIIAYLDHLEDPNTLEFETDEVRRVVGVMASKARSLATGEPEKKDELHPRVMALLEGLRGVREISTEPSEPRPLAFVKHSDRVELVDTAGMIIETLTLEEFAERQNEGRA